MPVDLSEQRSRLLMVVLLVLVLGSVFVWYGTLTYDPARNDFPEDENVAPTPEAYVGDRVTLHGMIVDTDPTQLEIMNDGESWIVTLENADTALIRGDDLGPGSYVAVHGTLSDDETLETDRVTTREPWEETYMYAISLVGSLWVLGRVLTGWQIDRDRLAIVPRDHHRSLVTLLGRSSDGDDGDQNG